MSLCPQMLFPRTHLPGHISLQVKENIKVHSVLLYDNQITEFLSINIFNTFGD